jgi:hypothetical protein
MPKPGKRQLSDKMQERNPLDMRQQIIPVDILVTEGVQRTDRPNNDTERLTERLEGTEETRDKNDSSRRIKKANPDTEQKSEYRDVSEESNQDRERKQRTSKAKTKTEQTSERSRNTNKLNARIDVSKKTVLQELRQGVKETTTPRAERYSFEIYPDQKDRIKELQNLYQQKTGQKLSASRILREGLDMYLEKAFQLLNEKA